MLIPLLVYHFRNLFNLFCILVQCSAIAIILVINISEFTVLYFTEWMSYEPRFVKMFNIGFHQACVKWQQPNNIKSLWFISAIITILKEKNICSIIYACPIYIKKNKIIEICFPCIVILGKKECYVYMFKQTLR